MNRHPERTRKPRKRKDKGIALLVKPKYVGGKPTIVLLDGTYCIACGAFLAPPEATDDERINKALEHLGICPGEQK